MVTSHDLKAASLVHDERCCDLCKVEDNGKYKATRAILVALV